MNASARKSDKNSMCSKKVGDVPFYLKEHCRTNSALGHKRVSFPKVRRRFNYIDYCADTKVFRCNSLAK